MLPSQLPITRRQFVNHSAGVGLGYLAANHCGLASHTTDDNLKDKALVAITLDLEMSRNFPKWEDTHWDYEKGNLNAETKAYTVEAAKRIKAHGGKLHCFAVGQVFEQPDVTWLSGLAKEGHPIGNHTYDHVYLLAKKPEEVQFRFRRAPWLIEGKAVNEILVENIRMTTRALKARAGIDVSGFRTPGGFRNALNDRPDLQKMLLNLGFSWVSSKYPSHDYTKGGVEPSADVYRSIVEAQQAAQPWVYETGLIEIPMSPISDIGAFRTGRWKLEWFLKAIKQALEWAIENRAVFDFLGHPSCLYVTDPEFRTIEMICETVRNAGDRAALVDLNAIARHTSNAQ